MDNDVNTLAQVIYHEARGESQEGKIAVGQVVLNRVNDPRFPNTVYKVVYQPKQFSNMRSYRVPQEYITLATGILAGNFANRVGKALYFNAIRRKNCKIRIGAHCFF